MGLAEPQTLDHHSQTKGLDGFWARGVCMTSVCKRERRRGARGDFKLGLLGFLIFSLLRFRRDPIYNYFSQGYPKPKTLKANPGLQGSVPMGRKSWGDFWTKILVEPAPKRAPEKFVEPNEVI